MHEDSALPWQVLGLDASWTIGISPSSMVLDPTRAALLRRAYRRSLLQHHPDKHLSSSASPFTVDQIRTAYTALGGALGGGSHETAAADTSRAAFAASTRTTPGPGLDVADLDDLVFDDSTGTWSRACRCGNPRGFVVGEADLEEELDAEALEVLVEAVATIDDDDEANASKHVTSAPTNGELLVECQDCSLWLCVHFALVAGDEDDEVDEEEP